MSIAENDNDAVQIFSRLDTFLLHPLDVLCIQGAHLYQEYLELATDEYSDWWQFERNQTLGMYPEGAD